MWNSAGRNTRARCYRSACSDSCWLTSCSARKPICRLNPQNFGTPNVTPDLAFNTAVSFVTNTNWQSYSGESTLSYLVQMAALTVQNFLSGAAGIAIAIAVVRGFARQQMKTIGNFWVDLTRAAIYVLLPLSLIGALFLCSQGVDPKPSSLHEGQDRGRRHANYRARTRGFPGSHQDGGHQRRRIFRRQLLASV